VNGIRFVGKLFVESLLLLGIASLLSSGEDGLNWVHCDGRRECFCGGKVVL